MSTGDGLPRVREALARGEPIDLVYHDRGGPPGRGYEANHLTLRRAPDGASAVYLKTRFDEAAPPYRTDRFELPSDDPSLLMADVLARTFAARFDEEADPQIGGVTRITFALVGGGETVEKVFYQRVPAALRDLEQAFVAMIELCASKGSHSVMPRR